MCNISSVYLPICLLYHLFISINLSIILSVHVCPFYIYIYIYILYWLSSSVSFVHLIVSDCVIALLDAVKVKLDKNSPVTRLKQMAHIIVKDPQTLTVIPHDRQVLMITTVHCLYTVSLSFLFAFLYTLICLYTVSFSFLFAFLYPKLCHSFVLFYTPCFVFIPCLLCLFRL